MNKNIILYCIMIFNYYLVAGTNQQATEPCTNLSELVNTSLLELTFNKLNDQSPKKTDAAIARAKAIRYQELFSDPSKEELLQRFHELCKKLNTSVVVQLPGEKWQTCVAVVRMAPVILREPAESKFSYSKYMKRADTSRSYGEWVDFIYRCMNDELYKEWRAKNKEGDYGKWWHLVSEKKEKLADMPPIILDTSETVPTEYVCMMDCRGYQDPNNIKPTKLTYAMTGNELPQDTVIFFNGIQLPQTMWHQAPEGPRAIEECKLLFRAPSNMMAPGNNDLWRKVNGMSATPECNSVDSDLKECFDCDSETYTKLMYNALPRENQDSSIRNDAYETLAKSFNFKEFARRVGPWDLYDSAENPESFCFRRLLLSMFINNIEANILKFDISEDPMAEALCIVKEDCQPWAMNINFADSFRPTEKYEFRGIHPQISKCFPGIPEEELDKIFALMKRVYVSYEKLS